MFGEFQLAQVAELRSLVIRHRESESDLRYGAKLRNKSGARHERAILHEEKYRDTSD